MIQIIAWLFSLTVGIYSFKKKSITTSGLIALITICSLFIISNELAWLAIIFYMFASSSILSKILPQTYKVNQVVAKSGARDYIQALANLGVATLVFCLYLITKHEWLMVGFVASVAAANADSWASEVGSQSKPPPRLITSFKKVQQGISGGITFIGTLGGLLGGLFIILLTYFTLPPTWQHYIFSPVALLSILVGGLSGLFIDSYLGAWFQALYQKDDRLNEKENGQLIKGYQWMNNDLVNFLSTLSAAALSLVLYAIFH